MEGLHANGLTSRYTHLLTGYIGAPSFLAQVVQLASQLHADHDPNRGPFTYLCDPVLGDHGRMYVAPEMVDLYRTQALPLATIVTPNQFEAELLTQRPIKTLQDALAACDTLHDLGPHAVIITSAELEERGERASATATSTSTSGQDLGIDMPRLPTTSNTMTTTGDLQKPKQQYTLIASIRGADGHPSQRVKATFPCIEAYFTGPGDLLAALLLAWLSRCPGDLAGAVRKALSTMQRVLRATARASGQLLGKVREGTGRGEGEKEEVMSPASLTGSRSPSAALVADAQSRSATSCRLRELRLVQNIEAVRNPPVVELAGMISVEPIT